MTMNVSAEKIYEKLKALQKERDELTHHIKQLSLTTDLIKNAVHHTEAEIMIDSAVTHSVGMPDFHLTNDIRNLSKEKHDLQTNTTDLKNLTNKLHALNREIEHDTFWMHYADSQDLSHQHEAERRVFG